MRKNPTITTSSANLDPVIPGIDNLPNPSGKNMSVQEKGNAMPEVNMAKNDGDQSDVSSPAFANGQDKRNREGGPRSNPTPAMPGA